MRDYVEVGRGVRARLVHCSHHIVVIETQLDSGAEIPPHSHESLQVTILLKGRLALKIGSSEIVLTPTSYTIIPPNTVHSAKALEETVVLDANAPLTADRRQLLERLGAKECLQYLTRNNHELTH